jgi:hypothetical protein
LNPSYRPKTIPIPKKRPSIIIPEVREKLTTATTILIYHIGSLGAKP